jgi:hypothetical protein
VRQRRWGHGSRVRGSEEGGVSGSGRRGGGGQGGALTERRADREARDGAERVAWGQGGARRGAGRRAYRRAEGVLLWGGVLGVLGALVGQGVLGIYIYIKEYSRLRAPTTEPNNLSSITLTFALRVAVT